MESILNSIKKLLGIEEDFTQFDDDIIMGINTSFMSLNQIGVGPSEGFAISTSSEEWSDFIGTRKDIESVKTYVYIKTRLLFDPPQSSFLIEALNKQLTEIEWRLNIQVDGGN